MANPTTPTVINEDAVDYNGTVVPAGSIIGAQSAPSSSDNGGDIKEMTTPAGITIGYTVNPLTGEVTKLYAYNAKQLSQGSGAQPRNDALTAASEALSGYLQAQSLADSRRLNAFDQMQKIAAYAIPAGTKNFPGYGPGESAHQFAAMMGAKTYTPPALTPTTVNPSKLADAAPVPQDVLDRIGSVLSAGGVG